MTKNTIVSISVLFILMASSQAFAERGSDASEGSKGLKSPIAKVTDAADASGKGNGVGNDHGGNHNGGGHGHGNDHDDGTPGQCRGNVSPC